MESLVPEFLSVIAVCAAVLGWWQSSRRGQGITRRMEELEQVVHSEARANEALQRALREMEEAAMVDRLTGAWNRRRFEETASAEMALASRRRSPVSVALLDLDHFKRVNDVRGHGVGDAVLAGSAATFRKELRISDVLVRWGGEEFLVLLPATGVAGATVLAEKLRRALERTPFATAGTVTVSVGVAEHIPEETLASWIERADRALYRAKAAGRNRVVSDDTPSPKGAFPSHNILELVWDDAYASGVAAIDAQHQRLFQASNAVLSAVTASLPMAEISLRLETMLAHTAQHFHDEEQLLRKAGYPDLDAHLKAHSRLLERARELQEKTRGGDVNLGGLVNYLATELVKGHLLSTDRHYFDHLERTQRKTPAPG
jgi:diguanylate cyclase